MNQASISYGYHTDFGQDTTTFSTDSLMAHDQRPESQPYVWQTPVQEEEQYGHSYYEMASTDPGSLGGSSYGLESEGKDKAS